MIVNECHKLSKKQKQKQISEGKPSGTRLGKLDKFVVQLTSRPLSTILITDLYNVLGHQV